MYNFEDIIEKYRRELMEISKQSSLHSEEEPEDERAVQEVFATTEEELPDEDEPITTISGRLPFADYDEFLRNNPSRGILRVQAFTANQAFPVDNAAVRVYIDLADGERELYSGITDVDGIADNISLPTPDSSISFNENSTIEPYAVYILRVNKPGYSPALFEGIPVFDSIKSIQPVELIPLSADANAPTQVITQPEPMTLFGGEN